MSILSIFTTLFYTLCSRIFSVLLSYIPCSIKPYLPRRLQGKRTIVIGLLCTTDYNEDGWMVADFVLHCLLWIHDKSSYDSKRSVWLASNRLPDTHKFGDPAGERLILHTPHSSITTITTNEKPEELLQAGFILSLATICRTIGANDELVIIFAGHGKLDTGDLLLGLEHSQVYVSRSQVEYILESNLDPRFRQCVTVVNGACFSETWKSQHWALLAASGASEEASSMVESASSAFRGGVLAYSMLAAVAHTAGASVPTPSDVAYDEYGVEASRKCPKYDIGIKEFVPKTPLQLWSTLPGLCKGLNEYRESYKRLLYDEATFKTSSRWNGAVPLPQFSAELHKGFSLIPANPKNFDTLDSDTDTASQASNSVLRPGSEHIDDIWKQPEPRQLPPSLATYDFATEVNTVAHIMQSRALNLKFSRLAGLYLNRGQLPMAEHDIAYLKRTLRNQYRIQRMYWGLVCALGWEEEAIELWLEGFTVRRCSAAIAPGFIDHHLKSWNIFSSILRPCINRALNLDREPLSVSSWQDPTHWIRGVWKRAGYPASIYKVNWEETVHQVYGVRDISLPREMVYDEQ